MSELKVHIELTRFVQPEKIEIDANERAVNEKSQYCFFVCTTFDSFLNDLYIEQLKSNITPNYLRDIQPNHMACLLLSLIEQIEYGVEYQHTTIALANMLAKKLEKYGFNIAKISDEVYTMTHQIFLLMTKKETDFFYNQALDYNISLNQKHKKLFSEDGIRLGTQQIARYNWEEQDIDELAKLLFLIKHKGSLNEIKTIRKKLIDKKIPHFTYNEIIIE